MPTRILREQEHRKPDPGPKKTVVLAYHLAADFSPYRNEELRTLNIKQHKATPDESTSGRWPKMDHKDQEGMEEMIMATRDERIRRQKLLGVVLALLLSAAIVGCGEGYVGSEGAVLLPYLNPANLYELTQNPDPDIWIIDVRPNPAYLLGHIPTAKSFPSSEIASRLDELPKDKYLILECETGARAQAVIENVLEPNGYTRFMNWGGFYRWPYEFIVGPNP